MRAKSPVRASFDMAVFINNEIESSVRVVQGERIEGAANQVPNGGSRSRTRKSRLLVREAESVVMRTQV